MAMQNKIKAFDAGMDLATAQILLSQGCFVIWRDIEDKHPDFVYKKERDLAKELPEEVVIEKLIKTIKILLGFERYQHIHYLLSIFDLSEKGRLSLMDVISADKRIKTHPDVERAYNEIHGFHFNLQEAECHIAPFPLIPKEEISQKLNLSNAAENLDWGTRVLENPLNILQQDGYKSHRLNILLLGSFTPGMRKLIMNYHSGESTLRDKLESGKPLYRTELLLYIREILESNGHRIWLGNCDRRDKKSVWHRMADLMENCDFIIVFMTNTGGIVTEATMLAERDLGHKVVYFVPDEEKISGLMKQGLFLLPRIKIIWYKTDDELLDYVIRTTEAFQAEHYRICHQKSEIAFRGFFNVRRDRINLPNGKEMNYDTVEIKDVVSILAVTESNKVVLCRQYRHPVREYVLDLPAGIVRSGEDLVSAAKRELEEETGYVAEEFRELGTFYPLAGITDMRLHYFLAQRLKKGTQNLDSTEFIEVKLVDLDELIDRIYKNAHRDLPSSNAILMYKHMKK